MIQLQKEKRILGNVEESNFIWQSNRIIFSVTRGYAVMQYASRFLYKRECLIVCLYVGFCPRILSYSRLGWTRLVRKSNGPLTNYHPPPAYNFKMVWVGVHNSVSINECQGGIPSHYRWTARGRKWKWQVHLVTLALSHPWSIEEVQIPNSWACLCRMRVWSNINIT